MPAPGFEEETFKQQTRPKSPEEVPHFGSEYCIEKLKFSSHNFRGQVGKHVSQQLACASMLNILRFLDIAFWQL